MRGLQTPLDTVKAWQRSSNQGDACICEENSNTHADKSKQDKGNSLSFRSYIRNKSLLPLPAVLQRGLQRIHTLFIKPHHPKHKSFLNRFRLANPSGKFKKPVRLQHLKIVIEFLLSSLDLNSLRCGKPQGKGFVNRSIEEIERFTGLKYCTVQRCIQDLVKAGFLTVERLHKKLDDQFIGYASIRRFTPLFFTYLGLTIKPKPKAAPTSSETHHRDIPRCEPVKFKRGIQSIKKILGILDSS